MSLTTLLDFLPRFEQLGDREAVRFDNGFRRWRLSYRVLYRRIAGVSRLLTDRNLKPGDRALLWCENRPEWLAVFWACVAQGIQVVPVDYRSSPQLLERIQQEVDAKLLVYGAEVEAPPPGPDRLSALELSDLEADQVEAASIAPDHIVQIVYTSGTTGAPRGVVHRHQNLCSNLNPIQQEIERYRAFARPFQPIRILSLLPLSHVFGQAVALFVPPMLGGSAVFMSEIQPQAMIRVIRSTRVSVLAVVPRMLEALSREIRRRHSLAEVRPVGKGWLGAARRWWKYRQVHRELGWKFWCFVVGGAAVQSESETFWSSLGFAVIQGYGLTEASPVVAVNHPFSARQGSIGRAVPGQEVKLAADGEILVRGPSVATEILGENGDSGTRLDHGWLHTGDLGRVDESGQIYFLGRKKDVIVTPEGLNVFPQDVEPVLRRRPGVRDCVVLGRPGAEGDQVHAVILPDSPSASIEAEVRAANQELESHQRIRSWTVWQEMDFPRTASTLKVKRAEVARRIAESERSAKEGESGKAGVDAALWLLDRREASEDRELERDLGLSSLDRVELLSRLEDRYGVQFDEERFARLKSTSEVRRELQQLRQGESPAASAAHRFPHWSSRAPVSWSRRVLVDFLLLPAQRRLVCLEVAGLDHLETLEPPAIFAANHSSHLDTTVLMQALPSAWRHRLAPAMRKEYFRPFFEPEGHTLRARLRSGLKYYLACGLFHAYPLPRQMGGVRSSLEFTGKLIDRGDCPLIFPEGARSPDGELLPFREGVGLMAVRLSVPIVPVWIHGTHRIWSKFDRWPTQRGRVKIKLGPPLDLRTSRTPAEAAGQVETAVRSLSKSE